LNLFAAQRPAQSAEEQEARDRRREAIQAQLATVPREERVAKYASELRTYSAYVDWDASRRLGELAMPVLVVYGTGDTVFPDVGWERLVAGHPNIEYRAFDGAEHGVASALPEALDLILGFLQQHTPETAR
jgi:pimeloyl-ACP methyl ester carboxylesterase